MNFRIFCLVAALVLSISVFAAQTPEEDVSKARLLLSPNRWVQMHYFLQAGANYAFNDEYTSKNDFFINRNRLVFNGQTADKFYFFFQTEDFAVNNGAPKSGDNTLYVQDAYIHYDLSDSFQIFAGQMPIPFTRMNNQSAATTLTNDIDANAVSFYNYSVDGRDAGLMFRGFLFQRYLEYRMGMFRGRGREIVYENPDDPESRSHVVNKGDWPRFSSRLQVHIGDREEGLYYSENYLGKRDIFEFGFGLDFQPSVYDKNNDGDPRNYFAITFDAAADRQLAGSNAFAFQAALTYGQGNPFDSDRYEDLEYNKYFILYAQAGMLFAGKWQPFGKYSMYNRLEANDNGGDYTFHTLSGGVNYFIDGHNANIRAQYDLPFGDNKDRENEHKITLQMQCYL